MSSAAPGSTAHLFEVKSAQLPLVALLLKTSDWTLLAEELTAQFGSGSDSADFFDHDALVIDFSHLPAGEYTFRVTAANQDGIWNGEGAAVVDAWFEKADQLPSLSASDRLM